jgi:hypothetical protein
MARPQGNQSLGFHEVTGVESDVNSLQYAGQHQDTLQQGKVLADTFSRTGTKGKKSTGMGFFLGKEALRVELLRVGPMLRVAMQKPGANANQ